MSATVRPAVATQTEWGDLFSKEQKQHFDDIKKIQEEVGLSSWTLHRDDLKEKESSFPWARTRLLEILAFPDLDVRFKSLELLRRLFEQDPLTEKTAVGLKETLEQLSALVEKVDNFTLSEQKRLIGAYSAGAECLLSHLGQENVLGVSRLVKKSLDESTKLLTQLEKHHQGRERDPELYLDIEYLSQGILRFPDDQPHWPFAPTAKSMFKFAASACLMSSEGVQEAVKELWSQAEEVKKKLSIAEWHETVYIFRHAARKAVCVLPKSKQVTLEDKRGATTFSIHMIQQIYQSIVGYCKHFGVKDKQEMTSPWQALVAAASAYEHIITYLDSTSQDDPQSVYRTALSRHFDQPGLMAILSHAMNKKGNQNYLRVEKALIQILSRLIDLKIADRFDKKTLNVFEEGLFTISDQIQSEKLKKDFNQEIREKIDNFQTKYDQWKNREKEKTQSMREDLSEL